MDYGKSLGNFYYKRDGTVYPGNYEEQFLAWARDIEDPIQKVVKCEKLKNGIVVSTIWLGLNHQIWGRDEKPMIFETMIFPPDGWDDLDMERYSTEIEALEGHERMKKKWSRKRKKQNENI